MPTRSFCVEGLAGENTQRALRGFLKISFVEPTCFRFSRKRGTPLNIFSVTSHRRPHTHARTQTRTHTGPSVTSQVRPPLLRPHNSPSYPCCNVTFEPAFLLSSPELPPPRCLSDPSYFHFNSSLTLPPPFLCLRLSRPPLCSCAFRSSPFFPIFLPFLITIRSLMFNKKTHLTFYSTTFHLYVAAHRAFTIVLFF